MNYHYITISINTTCNESQMMINKYLSTFNLTKNMTLYILMVIEDLYN